MNKKTHKLTDEQKIEIVNLYKTNNYTCIQIGKMYNITGESISRMLKRRGIIINNNQSILQRKYSVNKHYFDNIDTEAKAYILGFMYADGYNNIKANCIVITLSITDKDILEKIKEEFQSNKPIIEYNYKNKKYAHKNQQKIVNLTIHCKEWCKILTNLGCPRNKTYKIRFPKWLDKKLIRHFIRGYFDGDGCVNENGYITTITSNKQFCKELINIIKQNININCKFILDKRCNGKIGNLFISNKLDRYLFLSWIYNNNSISLNRKYTSYLNMVKNDKFTKRPTRSRSI